MFWNTETDNVGFKFTLKQKKMTRRGLLSIISSVYDPLGLVAPFLLQGRLLNQDLRRANLGWDEVIPEKIQMVQRFKIFVANRVELIKDNSDESQWHHFRTEPSRLRIKRD